MSAPLEVPKRTRYAVSPSESWIAFEARSTLHAVRARADGLDGYVEAEIGADGVVAMQPPPAMHVEFPVERLRSGNALQDGEMWKLIDSKRFPRIAADLRDLEPLETPGRYRAAGAITLAGRSRTYAGELTMTVASHRITIGGDLSLDIRDFGLTPPRLLLFKVEPVLRATLHLVAGASA